MLNIIRFIGDVHGKFKPYVNILKDSQKSIQVGDMGVGFRHRTYDPGEVLLYPNPPHDKMVELGNHRFIRGNHDNPGVCKNQSYWIPDGTIEDNMFLCGGASSIDRASRIEGFDWWADEQLSYGEWQEMIDKVVSEKSEILVTHECPEHVVKNLFHWYDNGIKIERPSVTRKALETIYMEYKPKVHIFGHWHEDRDVLIDGTRFICLNELSYIDLDINDPLSGKIVSRFN